MGLKEGDPDPHWQVVARSDDPHFKPRPAVVTAVGPDRLANDPAGSQWISIGNGPPELPPGVTITFRTTFELRGAAMPTSRSFRACRAEGDKHVKAVRVNGHRAGRLGDENVRMPKQAYNPRRQAGGPLVGKEWVEGTNYVDIDVTNEDPSHPAGGGPILLRVTWR